MNSPYKAALQNISQILSHRPRPNQIKEFLSMSSKLIEIPCLKCCEAPQFSLYWLKPPRPYKLIASPVSYQQRPRKFKKKKTLRSLIPKTLINCALIRNPKFRPRPYKFGFSFFNCLRLYAYGPEASKLSNCCPPHYKMRASPTFVKI